MMAEITARTCAALAAAIVSTTGVGVINAAPAGAACANWTLGPELQLNLSNGQTAIFQTSGNDVTSGQLLIPGGRVWDAKKINSGGLRGADINFTVRWIRRDPSTSTDLDIRSAVTGTVADDGTARGGALDDRNARVDWVARDRLTCADAPPPEPAPAPVPAPAPAPAPEPAAPTATVTSDVDVYDAPGGGGNVIGILRQGEVVKVVKPCSSNDWCALADGRFAWGEFFRNN